jgi:hypothetical protein
MRMACSGRSKAEEASSTSRGRPKRSCGLAQTIKLPELLHAGVRWCRCPSPRWSLDGERAYNAECIFTSAAGVYSGMAAEHALALMLAGARRLDGATYSAYRPS